MPKLQVLQVGIRKIIPEIVPRKVGVDHRIDILRDGFVDGPIFLKHFNHFGSRITRKI